ncbi:thiamine pyrophosphate-dependent enzyme [Roseibium salinum]|nr:thiamine pyrophosphate-dependent enzyme [Roseibium salinum]
MPQGRRPVFFIELDTYRYHGHHVGDINRDYYRSRDEEAEWKKRYAIPSPISASG